MVFYLFKPCALLINNHNVITNVLTDTIRRNTTPHSIYREFMSSSQVVCYRITHTRNMIPTSFLQFQIAHTKVQTPIRILDSVFLSNPFNQFPNKNLILVGGGMLKVRCSTLHINFANVHLMNICSIVSSLSQKAHFLQTSNFSLTIYL
jgi:hypothetical protein